MSYCTTQKMKSTPKSTNVVKNLSILERISEYYQIEMNDALSNVKEYQLVLNISHYPDKGNGSVCLIQIFSPYSALKQKGIQVKLNFINSPARILWNSN